MNERIHRYLDGELPYDVLTKEERSRVEGYATLLDRVGRSSGWGRVPDLAPAVQDRIAGLSIEPRSWRWPIWAAVWEWLWKPREVRLRPLAVLTPAAAVAVLLVLILRPTPGDGGADAATVFVQFRLDAPAANSVALAGDFTRWRPAYALHRTHTGVWSVVVPLGPGVHEYAFVVDGERWVPDPLAAQVADGFGGTNSRVSVLVPDRGRRS